MAAGAGAWTLWGDCGAGGAGDPAVCTASDDKGAMVGFVSRADCAGDFDSVLGRAAAAAAASGGVCV